ncbi:MAG TPA: NAD(P)-dependent oxidoreductase [Ramlibacter sp.]|uniref:NAD(P)-dependent oxidoreductase n=1 Tax=Ramlibacter sp. TaxID=1917967 RepID=UPI002D808A87|nr:NAD(P)-dependent oxidoreductase [Ramlibacter sp.]HET8747843.1 NAD(P)-dependent oxidoreductase [Ramlibacter sp.]
MEILLLERLAPEAQAWLQARHRIAYRPELAEDAAALRRQLYNVQALVLPRKVVVTRELLDFAPVLRAIARLHVGTEHTDLEACRDHRVRVIQGTHAHVRSNAEYLLAGLLLLMRRGIGAALKGDREAPPLVGRELNGSTVGIVGLAPAAHALALMLNALGVRLIGYDPAVHHTASVWRRLHIEPMSLQDVLSHADAVSVQLPYASRFQGFMNDKVLAHCRPGQLWVATTRTRIFEPNALAQALKDGRIEAAMLDGAEAGFAGRGSPLADLPNLHLTPRIASLTQESRQRASWYVAQRLHETLALPRSNSFDTVLSGPAPLDSQPTPLSGPGPL